MSFGSKLGTYLIGDFDTPPGRNRAPLRRKRGVRIYTNLSHGKTSVSLALFVLFDNKPVYDIKSIVMTRDSR